MTDAFKTVASPVGTLKLVASDEGLVAILWQDDDPARVRKPLLGMLTCGVRASEVELDVGQLGVDD